MPRVTWCGEIIAIWTELNDKTTKLLQYEHVVTSYLTDEPNFVTSCGSDKDFPFGNSSLSDKQQLNAYTLKLTREHMFLL